MSYKYLFKYIIIGDSSVGKSCLLLKFTDGRFRKEHDLTIGVEFGSKEIEVRGELLHLQIWDTAGQENFRSITRAYYKGATAALLVYDVTRRSSFQSLQNWLSEIHDNANANIVTVLVGNKIDLSDRQISPEEGRDFAEENGLLFMETSAQTGLNVEDVFVAAATEVLNRVNRGEIVIEQNNLNISKPSEKKGGCCSDS